jgi:hypothetical protein
MSTREASVNGCFGLQLLATAASRMIFGLQLVPERV